MTRKNVCLLFDLMELILLLARNLSRMGREYAIVLPDPVRSLTITSLPSEMELYVFVWTGNRFSMSLSDRDFIRFESLTKFDTIVGSSPIYSTFR